MKTSPSIQRNRALTLVELLVVIAVVTILFAMILPGGTRKAPPLRIACVNNLRQIGTAYRVWGSDNLDKFPMAIPQTNGGTMEFITGPNAWRHFQVMSNELSTPLVLFCPAEESWRPATNFTFLNNSNLSFFVGVDASKANPMMILSGDRNLTNGAPMKNGLLSLTRNRPAGWNAEMHNKMGNIGLADGSVQQASIPGLQTTVAKTGFTTNRLQIPVLNP